ncbi:MAG: chemotaxis protein CheA [Sinobacterium sp.]|nr:chemotaxis protein CheA [Sinobacterium sp.]
MDDGYEEIKQIFLEESYEGIDIMEQGLLELDPHTSDLDKVNQIFRAAHSIKGGGGTFGFTEISDFTHGAETLLDEMRNEKRNASDNIIQVLLDCVDCLRDMLNGIRDNSEHDKEQASTVQAKITSILESSEGKVGEPVPEAPAIQDTIEIETTNSEEAIAPLYNERTWEINFTPHYDILQSGNEPPLIFRELGNLGELDIHPQLSQLPAFNELEPKNCYLSWQLTLTSSCDIVDIESCFDWVSQQADISIEALAIENTEPQKEQPSAVKPAEPEGYIDLSAYVPAAKKAPEPSDHPKTVDEVFDNFKAGSERENKIIQATKQIEMAKQNAEKAAAKKKPKAKEAPTNTNAEQSSIRVSTDKVDNLMDLVGELVITQSMLARFGKDYNADNMEELKDGLAQLERNARELQESSMSIRMLPIKSVFNRFPRLIRDLSGQLGKKIELQIEGEQTELDKIVMEKIGDPLVHLVRNSIDHGIEIPEQRIASGKPEIGILKLNAYHEAGNIVIEIIDDGAGLNKQRILEKAIESGIVTTDEVLNDEAIHNLIFQPGFSTADEVTDISGRGVGMDVVKRNIHDIGGRVEVSSEEEVGTTFTIRLPLTLAILDGQLVKAGGDIFVIPLLAMIESVLIDPSHVSVIGNTSIVYHFREEYISIADLSIYGPVTGKNVDSFNSVADHLLVVCECDGKKFGIVVEEMSDQQQVVIKSLDVNYKHVQGLSGGTILGDGRVALILDPVDFMDYCMNVHTEEPAQSLQVNS